MKKILPRFTLFSWFAITASATISAQCPVTAPLDATIACGGTHTATAGTNFVTYSIVNTTCTPVAITGTNAFPTTCDDCVTGQIPIGFPFSFYGNTYTTAVIQSNGIVGFGPFTFTGYNAFAIPAGGLPNNYIAGIFTDIDIRFGGSITYQTVGTAPNRRFVVSYNNVVPYNAGSAAGPGTASFQIVLNENGSFNVIISQFSANWSATTSGVVATSGAENDNGTIAFPVLGRNSTDWRGIVPGSQDCRLFNPAPCTFLRWQEGATVLTTDPTLTTSPSATATYTAYWNCSGTTCSDDMVVTVGGSPTPLPVTHCQNEPSQALGATVNCFTTSAGATVNQGAIFNTGTLATTDPRWNKNGSGTFCDATSGTSNPYDLVTFTVSTAGSYTFNMCTPGTNWDGHASLYQNAFNPANPCGTPANFIVADDDGNTGGNCENDSRLIASLVPRVTYYLITTNFSGTGNYEWTYTGPAGATISVSGAPIPAPVNWYTVPTGGSVLATGTTFNPVGFSGSGLPNTTTPGTYTYYAACSQATACRTPVTYTITAGPVGTGVTICRTAASQSMTSAVTCGATTSPIAQGATFNSGALAAGDASFVRGVGTTSCASSAGTSHFVDVFQFTVSTAGTYVFDGCFPSIDAYGQLYQNAFNPANPCAVPTNFVTANDDSAPLCGSDPRLTASLVPGVTYFLVSTSFSAGGTGTYSWTYTGPAGGTIGVPGAPSTLQWYTAASGGSPIGTGSPFNPVGAAGSGLANTNTAGTTTYYLACGSAPACRSNIPYVITPSNTIATGTSPTICINSAIANITLATTGATGATFTGLPAGVTGSWAANVVTISGTPTVSGTFNYTVTTTGGCTPANTSGTITVTLAPTASAGTPAAVCESTARILAGSVTNATGLVWTSSGSGTFSPNATTGNASYTPTTADAAVGAVTLTLTSTGSGACPAAVSTAVLNINTQSTTPVLAPFTSVICPNTDAFLNVTGGTSGTSSTVRWYTGANGTGTLVNSGITTTVAPITTTVYYVRREGTCNTTTDAVMTVNVKDFIYAADGTSTTTYCTDNAGWHHFFVGDQIILSLQGDISSMGTITATIRDNGAYYMNGGNPLLCNTGFTPGEQQFEMERSWNIAHTGALNGLYNVRFYYQPAERTAVETAAANWLSTYTTCGYSYKYNAGALGWFWFKNTLGNYPPPMYDGLHLIPTGNGVVGSGNINYTVLGGITSFSGGTGGVILVPDILLGTELVNFRGRYDANTKFDVLNWETNSEINNARFDVERSASAADGFVKIGEVAGHGTTIVANSYQFNDTHPLLGVNYYRLRQVDTDGSFTYSQVIAIETPSEMSSYIVYPNPTSGALTYQFYLDTPDKVEIELLNLLGQRLQTRTFELMEGVQQLQLDLSDYPNATYTLRIKHANSNAVRTVKVIKAAN